MILQLRTERVEALSLNSLQKVGSAPDIINNQNVKLIAVILVLQIQR